MIQRHYGFTLLELIAIIVVGGILAAILTPFMTSALTDSHKPIQNLQEASGLSSDMAEIVAEHRLGWNPNPNLPDCTTLRDQVAGYDLTHSELAEGSPQICHFNNKQLDCNNPDNCDTSACVLQVRLQSDKNPGESASSYFPCE